MQYGHINSPFKSKINWVAGIGAVFGVLTASGVIPKEAGDAINQIGLLAVGVLVPVFRTWFTVKKA